MGRVLLFGILVVSLFLTACSVLPEPTRGTQDEHATAVTLTLQEINEGLPSRGSTFIDAYVSEVYTCPPCPETGFCNPCVGNHLIIADVNEYIPNYAVDPKAFFLFVNDVSMFETGKKYHFIVDVLAYEEKITSRSLMYISAREIEE